jgi:hypothetical protein
MVRASRIDRPLRIDGKLDEEVYVSVPGAGDFVQQLPRENQRATEATQLWVFFDDKNLYISARCFDSHPEREVATELRRDNNNIIQNENITIVLDTFYDRHNGFLFQTSSLGAIRDQSVADGMVNVSWNTVWDVKSARVSWRARGSSDLAARRSASAAATARCPRCRSCFSAGRSG